jgi:hypothetical protein
MCLILVWWYLQHYQDDSEILELEKSGIIAGVVDRMSPDGKVVRHVTALNDLEFGMSSLKKAGIQ